MIFAWILLWPSACAFTKYRLLLPQTNDNVTLLFRILNWKKWKVYVCLQRLLPYIQELFEFGINLNVDQWHKIIFLKSDFQSLRYLPSIISEPWEGCECEFAISFVKTSDTKWQHKPWFSPLKYLCINMRDSYFLRRFPFT